MTRKGHWMMPVNGGKEWAIRILLVLVAGGFGAGATAFAMKGDIAENHEAITVIQTAHDKDITNINRQLEGIDRKLDQLLGK